MTSVAVLMTCHNRRETTLRCLRSLHAAAQQVKGRGEGEQWHWHVFIVDDGSTDGTDIAVREWADHYCQPPTFNLSLIRGNGSLYWARGMALAWRTALEFEKGNHSTPTPNIYTSFSHFLWLNDDVVLRPEAFSALSALSTSQPRSVIVGELVNSRGEIVYGTRGDLFTGNFVLVPQSVFEKVGAICGRFRHAWADSDYALRCKRAGIPVVSCGVVGRCEGHVNRPSLAGVGLRSRWRMLWEPKGWCVHDLWLYRRRNWGLCAAIFSVVHLGCHVLKGER